MLRGGFNLAKWKFSSKALKRQVEKEIKELEEGEEKDGQVIAEGYWTKSFRPTKLKRRMRRKRKLIRFWVYNGI